VRKIHCFVVVSRKAQPGFRNWRRSKEQGASLPRTQWTCASNQVARNRAMRKVFIVANRVPNNQKWPPSKHSDFVRCCSGLTPAQIERSTTEYWLNP